MINTLEINMKSLIKIVVVVCVLILPPTIVNAHPGYNRLVDENAAGTHNPLLDLTNVGAQDVQTKVNEEFVGSVKERQKRLSDQRRAELETLMALSKMTGKLVSIPRGGRQLDTSKIGRRKRSVFELNLKNLAKLFKLSGNLGQKGNAAYSIIS